MTDEIAIIGPSLADFLNRIGLLASTRERVIEIDRELADELAGDLPDADGCAALVVEAAGLIADLDPAGFDWSGWDDDDLDDANSFNLDGMEWSEE